MVCISPHLLIIPSLDTSGDVMWCASHGGDVDAIKGCDVDTIMRDTVMETSTVHTMGYTTIPIMGCASLHILWDGVVCISPHLHITSSYHLCITTMERMWIPSGGVMCGEDVDTIITPSPRYLLWGDTIYRRYRGMAWCASLHISSSLHTMGWCASSRYLLWDGMG